MYLDQDGKRWFRGNLHTHSTVSDGLKTPDEVIRIYRNEGYDFLALRIIGSRPDRAKRTDCC